MARGHMLGAYWAARKESVEQCAKRLHRCLADLAACDPAFATWYERGRSRSQAQANPVKTGDGVRALVSLLDRGRNRRDSDRGVIEELGFQVGLWNGGVGGEEVGLSVTCGLYWESSSPRASLTNSVVLNIPIRPGDLRQAGQVACMLTAVAIAWEPEWAGVMSNEAMSARGFNAKTPFVDWMIFTRRKIDTLPAPSSATELQGLGSLIVVQPVPPSLSAPDELARIHQVERALIA
jgi:hypothetical protein